MWGYRTQDVARVLGLPDGTVRRLARAGFVSPRRGPGNALRFSFQDLVLLRAAAGLLAARVPAARVRRALRHLRAQLPPGRSLASVVVRAEGDAVVVRDGGARWQPETGQILLDFEVAELARRSSPVVKAAARCRGPAPLRAEGWYQWGLDLEAGAPARAREAFQRALELEPGHGGARLALGRLQQEAGELREAELQYRAALQDRARRPEAFWRLGEALEALGLPDDALLAYARALEGDPRLAVAHQRLAALLGQLGRAAEASRHLAAYRRLVRGA